ncbi:MAG: site-specific integrase [Firmicutes bacterium]|nr:site-specific integrase [Bacillota bacterium]
MAKRRGNDEGTVYKRKTCQNKDCKKITTGEDEKSLKVCRHCGANLPSDGLWVAVASIGYNPATGKPIRKPFYGKTKKEAIDKMQKARQFAKSAGGYVEPTKTTLGEWLDKWLTTYKKGQIRPSTYESYETVINRYLKPAFDMVPMAKLQANMLQNFYNEQLENGRADGTGGLSTRMVRYMHAIIRQALQQAVKEGILIRNVADATSPPVIKNKQMRPLAEAELLDFLELEAVKDDRLFAAYLLAATTGLRRGELLGLCWDCVDMEQGALTIQRQLLKLNSGLTLDDTTKTKSGRRSINMTDDAIRELKAHRKRQLQERLLMGAAYQDRNLVFCREDGSLLRPEEFTKRFQRHLVNAGLPKVRLHDLRHTHATLLLQRGIPAKLVQERLGHSSITMTLDLYSHVTPEMQKLAAESLNGLMAKASAKKEGLAKKQGE